MPDRLDFLQRQLFHMTIRESLPSIVSDVGSWSPSVKQTC
jgi:hypothetical protein